MAIIKLDHIDDINYNPQCSSIRNCQALSYLPEGLHQLALMVREEEIRKSSDSHAPMAGFSFGGDREEYYIACAFHWFASSMVAYGRLVAFVQIATRNGWMVESLADNKVRDKVKRHCRAFVQRVMPNIHVWRNKVSAHLAATDPFDEDNIGTLQDSMMYPIAYCRPCFWAQAHEYAKGDEKSAIPRWSLTLAFEELAARFFPQRQLPQFPPEAAESVLPPTGP